MILSHTPKVILSVAIALWASISVTAAVTGSTTAITLRGQATWEQLTSRDAIERHSGSQRIAPLDAIPLPNGIVSDRSSVKPPSSPIAQSASATSLAITGDFLALADDDTVIPPDAHGAAGPSHVMLVASSQVAVHSRDGEVVSIVDAEIFWAPAGAVSVFFSRILYDQQAGRWLVVCADDWAGSGSAVLFAISDSDDPTGGWSFYSFEADPSNVNAVSAPRIGFNGTWIAITANMHRISDAAFLGVRMWVIDKSTALTGGSLTVTDFATGFDQVGGAHSRVMQPCQTFGSSSDLYIVDNAGYFDNQTFIQLVRISQVTGTAGSPQWSVVPNSDYAGSGLFAVTNNFEWYQFDATQPGTVGQIDTYAPFAMSAVYRDGQIWLAHSGGYPFGGANRTAIFWYELDPSAMPDPIVQSGVVEDGFDTHLYYPSLAVNAAGDVMVAFSRSDATMYVEAGVVGRMSGDAAGTMSAPATLKAGEDSYLKTFGAGYVRWGRSSAAVIDPVDDMSMWVMAQYAAADAGPAPDDDRWGLWWGHACNPAGGDSDGDGFANACDRCAGFDDAVDSDGDGIADGCDRCAGFDDASDADGDSVPDGCDLCAGFDDGLDADSDGTPDGCDVCAGYDDGTDTDQDGTPDGCDICGGYDDSQDSDEDGVPDGCDICAGGDDSADFDGDGVPNSCDNCPVTHNPNQEDADQDNVGDACEGLACCGAFDPSNRTGNVSYDANGTKDLTDVLQLAAYAFLGGSEPPCLAEGNVSGDSGCILDLSDILALAAYAFLTGPDPAFCLPQCE